MRIIRWALLMILFPISWAQFAAAHLLLEAEDYDDMFVVVNNDSGFLSFCDDGDWLRFDNVDLSADYQTFITRVGALTGGGQIEVRLDGLTGPLCGTLTVAATGGWGTYVEQSVPITGASGIHDLFICFKGIYGVGSFDYFRFADPVDGPDPESFAPWPAATAGYETIAFEDDFDALGTIDSAQSHAPGYKWYTDRPFGWPATPASAYSVDNSVLTVKLGDYAGWTLASYSPAGRTGNAFRYGYFEARLRHNPAQAPYSINYPCWWSFSVAHTIHNNDSYWGELDFLEAYPLSNPRRYDGRLLCSVVDWRDGGNTRFLNSHQTQWAPTGTDFTQWHTYGCLWTPGQIRWFFDDQLLMTQYYSTGQPIPQSNPPGPDGVFSILDNEDMLLVLGADAAWTMDVDWVRVWQAEAPPLDIPLHYDMGLIDSPVAEKYTKTLAATPYSTLGYGWTDTSDNQARDRTINDDPLRRDFVFNSAPRVFRIDLENGSYHVTVTQGDAATQHDQMAIKANDTTVAAGVTTAAGQFVQSTFEVEIVDGSLHLEFSDAGGSDANWIVNAIAIAPSTTAVDQFWPLLGSLAPKASQSTSPPQLEHRNLYADLAAASK